MSGLLVGTLILWLIIAIIVIVVVVYVVNWLYHRSSSEVSFVRTGFLGERVVINGGAFVLPFIRDFTPVSMLAQFDMLLATKWDGRFDTVQKVVAYDRQNPRKLNFGTIAVGSTQNLSAELFKMVTGVSAAVVTFRTTPELMTPSFAVTSTWGSIITRR